MGLFEILFEHRNPGEVGGIEKNNRRPDPVDPVILVIKLIISAFITGFVFWATMNGYYSLSRTVTFIVIVSIYCLVSYIIVPRPAESNLGWLGGLFDNPFRYSDDINRMLLFMRVILLPGRFIATTLVQTIAAVSEFFRSRRMR